MRRLSGAVWSRARRRPSRCRRSSLGSMGGVLVLDCLRCCHNAAWSHSQTACEDSVGMIMTWEAACLTRFRRLALLQATLKALQCTAHVLDGLLLLQSFCGLH